MESPGLACALGSPWQHGISMLFLASPYTCHRDFESFPIVTNITIIFCSLTHSHSQAVVLFAMGGYGTYLGFRIRYSDDVVRYLLPILQLLITVILPHAHN